MNKCSKYIRDVTKNINIVKLKGRDHGNALFIHKYYTDIQKWPQYQQDSGQHLQDPLHSSNAW